MKVTHDHIEMIQPDDWHVHLRDGDMLKAVLPYTLRRFARAVVMPNLKPPVVTMSEAAVYRQKILALIPSGHHFKPLMTAYLTEKTDPEDLAKGHAAGIFFAAKLYPAGATTNAEAGVRELSKMTAVFKKMEQIKMPLLVHGE